MLNLTVEEFLSSLERSAEELPSVFAEWSALDEDLRIEYVDGLRWLLENVDAVLERARSSGRSPEIVPRLYDAMAAIERLRGEIEEKMGLKLDEIKHVSRPP